MDAVPVHVRRASRARAALILSYFPTVLDFLAGHAPLMPSTRPAIGWPSMYRAGWSPSGGDAAAMTVHFGSIAMRYDRGLHVVWARRIYEPFLR
jgi:hypothetical protein